MKRIILVLIILALVFAFLTGCTQKPEVISKDNAAAQEQADPVTAAEEAVTGLVTSDEEVEIGEMI